MTCARGPPGARDRPPELDLRVEVDPALPALPAAVEVALYRIAGEAVHNVVRHAGATRCTVRLAGGADAVRLDVTDDGVGCPPMVGPGVGRRAMRERAEELGGELHLGPRRRRRHPGRRHPPARRSGMTGVRVVIADDHRLFRRGIAALLAAVDGIEVVGEAADGEHAVALATELRPDVVLVDLHMPDGPGLDAIRRIRVEAPGVHALVLTMFDDDDSVFAALRAGARGYVLKDADGDELVRSILTVARGGALYGASVAARLSDHLASPATAPATPFADLTPGEHRVLEHMARGLNNDAIAAALGYSPKTVRNYVSIIFATLHVTDRAQAIVLAREHGLR